MLSHRASWQHVRAHATYSHLIHNYNWTYFFFQAQPPALRPRGREASLHPKPARQQPHDGRGRRLCRRHEPQPLQEPTLSLGGGVRGVLQPAPERQPAERRVRLAAADRALSLRRLHRRKGALTDYGLSIGANPGLNEANRNHSGWAWNAVNTSTSIHRVCRVSDEAMCSDKWSGLRG